MSGPAPWWTPADAAEQQVRVRDFVARYFTHGERCRRCQEREPCSALRKATEELLDWRDRRSGESLAVELRAVENIIDGDVG